MSVAHPDPPTSGKITGIVSIRKPPKIEVLNSKGIDKQDADWVEMWHNDDFVTVKHPGPGFVLVVQAFDTSVWQKGPAYHVGVVVNGRTLRAFRKVKGQGVNVQWGITTPGEYKIENKEFTEFNPQDANTRVVVSGPGSLAVPRLVGMLGGMLVGP